MLRDRAFVLAALQFNESHKWHSIDVHRIIRLREQFNLLTEDDDEDRDFETLVGNVLNL